MRSQYIKFKRWLIHIFQTSDTRIRHEEQLLAHSSNLEVLKDRQDRIIQVLNAEHSAMAEAIAHLRAEINFLHTCKRDSSNTHGTRPLYAPLVKALRAL